MLRHILLELRLLLNNFCYFIINAMQIITVLTFIIIINVEHLNEKSLLLLLVHNRINQITNASCARTCNQSNILYNFPDRNNST